MFAKNRCETNSSLLTSSTKRNDNSFICASTRGFYVQGNQGNKRNLQIEITHRDAALGGGGGGGGGQQKRATCLLLLVPLLLVVVDGRGQ